MQMSKPGLCCDECFEMLAKRSTAAARMWLDLCDIQSTCSLFALRIDDNDYMQLLEYLGFITTTDVPNLIVVKVHGQENDALGSFFCGGNCGR